MRFPPRLRYLLAWDHALCRAVVAVYLRAVAGWLRERAPARCGQRHGRRRGHPAAMLIRKFTDADITNQDFIDGCNVIVNGNRVKVVLVGV